MGLGVGLLCLRLEINGMGSLGVRILVSDLVKFLSKLILCLLLLLLYYSRVSRVALHFRFYSGDICYTFMTSFV